MTRLCFVSTRQGNHFMTELLSGVASVAADEGVPVSMVFDAFPPADPSTVYVVIPHEFFAVIPPEAWPTSVQLQRTIAFCVEMPGTMWFDLTATYAAYAGAAVTINRSAMFELERRGVRAEHFQLGYCREWDTWHGDPAEPRPIDVLYMASADERRARFLGGFARSLWRRRTSILVPPVAPKPGPRPDYLVGAEKYERMRSSKVLLNLHRGASRSLEWMRVLECLCNGCVVLSEHSRDHEPLVPGAHFVSASPENLGFLAEHLLEDPTRLAGMREAAYDFVRSELPMTSSVARLLAIAEGLAARRGSARGDKASTVEPLPSPAPAIPAAPAPIPDRIADELARVRIALKYLIVQNVETRRLIAALLPRVGAWDHDGVQVAASTPAFASAKPRVTVGVPLYNHAGEVTETLLSVAVSDYVDFDVLIYDDASTDRSAQIAESFLADHPWLPACLLRGRVNGGPARARNVLAARARGELLFFLDSDNKVYPSTLGRLVEMLEANPDAMFAYPMLSTNTGGVASGLVSALPWEPARLRAGNYIDTMALIRRADLIEMGGFGEDARLEGWEDYDLWCRCAERGRRGVLVPEILGWYRWTHHSLARLHHIDDTAVTSLIRERSPSLFESARP